MHASLRLSSELPQLDDPLVIAAFWGWSDSTGSAMGAFRHLREAWNATEVATVDPERFYDLTVARPQQQLKDGEPTIRWPGTRFYVAHPAGSGHNFVLLGGREPNFAWHTYAELVADFMQGVGAHRFLALGSRPGPVPHTRPSPLVLSDADGYFERLFARASQARPYEGPTGIHTIVSLHLRELGISTARLNAVVPAYLNVGPNPRAMLALVQDLNRALDVSTPVESLLDEIESFSSRMEAGISKLPDAQAMRARLGQLEEQYDALAATERQSDIGTLPSSDELLRNIEDLLRHHRDKDANR